MESDRSFNFKLLMPPRVNSGQVSAVRPQEVIENCGDIMNPLQQGYSMCFDKEQNMPFSNTSMVMPTKPTRQCLLPVIVLIPQINGNPGQLYSKLFDEVDRIKCWKVKVDSDTVQKERRLQENKRTIETQRKAIQELQFGNESLSIKLEEQISENEDLRNKNNATRNLCNILKDTFQRSAEKMLLFESEREETHHLFMENNVNIQKLVAAFESLRIRAEADQQEMQKVKEGLLQFEELKEKYHQEYNMKEEEVAELQTKLRTKENELQKILLDLHETQKHCKHLQETTNQQHELLKSSKTEQESLLQKLHTAEQRCIETEVSKKGEAIAVSLEQSKEEYAQTIHSKDLSIQELSRVKNQQAEKLEEIQATIQELQNSLDLERQSSLHDESQNLKRLNKEDCQKLLKDLEYKSTFAAELENEAQKLRLAAAEAIKNKEDAELKCQHKIADMVALMEKHKSQYDRMVEQKDAELDENKKKEMEAIAQRKSIGMTLIDLSTENDQLKKQLKIETTKGVCSSENLQKELTDLKKEILFISTYATTDDVVCHHLTKCSETPKESMSKRYMFDFSKTRKTPSHSKDEGSATVMKNTDVHNEDLKTPSSITDRVGGTSKIKSYRIRTPPSNEKASHWGKSTLELDPKSDSSDQIDLLTFANASNFSALHCKLKTLKKIQSPVTHKSPGNSLKLAAMKRMRDAGWTAVTGHDKKKKKKSNEKIFA
uniref:Synaptonemal complex protein 1 n=1 Tax=Lates calcarifer TaxID=8187 RepID=A0A4W6CIW5_LATCA